MATSPYFLEPLSLFRRRILYANAFSTDFVVPTGTAAFIHPRSSSIHRFGDQDDQQSRFYRGNRMIIATLYTEKQLQYLQTITTTGEKCDDELVEMSKCLDALGWKKVFVDMRDEIPISIPLPPSPNFSWMPSIIMVPALLKSRSSSSEMTSSPNTSLSVESTIASVTSRQFVQSKELIKMFSVSTSRISLPIGHNMIIAHTKPNSRFSTAVNKRGRPVMDSLAQELVHEVLHWNGAHGSI
jgi:hypothetical protein